MTTKVKVSRVGKRWHATCSRCAPFPFIPWLSAAVDAWDQALWWANWHAAEHDRTHCNSCDRDQDVPAAKILDKDAIRVGERLFMRHGKGWREAATGGWIR